jgi:hypothetical protein
VRVGPAVSQNRSGTGPANEAGFCRAAICFAGAQVGSRDESSCKQLGPSRLLASMAGSTGTPISAVNPCRSRSCTAIWVGRHPRGALRRTSRHGDGWHPVGAIAASPLPSREMHLDLETLKRRTEAEGRDFSVLTISYKAIPASRRRRPPPA